MPTQSDVARLAGVSTATVSRVINGRGVVTDDVRQRVQQAIDTLHYVPHAGARALALQRSGTLGAIIPTLNNAIFAEGINAFEQASRMRGYAFILAVAPDGPTQHLEQVMRMIERGVDGLLLVGNDHEAAVFDRLEKAAIRHVCTWAFDKRSRAPNIGFDNARAMIEVVDHLVALGHRRIGMLAGKQANNDRAMLRVRGVMERLNHHGIALPPSQIIELDISIRQARKAFWELIDQDISAIVCGNDVIAQGALLEALKTGIRIPEDISITGFDDLELSSELSPALTSVHVNAARMGELAAGALIDSVENKCPVQSHELSTRLIVRETSCRYVPTLNETSLSAGVISNKS